MPRPEDQPLSDLAGHRIEIATRCGCAKVTVFSPESLLHKLGPGASLRIAKARLICRTCHQRPDLILSREYGYSDGRDMRRDPPPLPEWVVPLLAR